MHFLIKKNFLLERKHFYQIEALLVEEISLVEKVAEDKTIEHLRSLCAGLCDKEFESSGY